MGLFRKIVGMVRGRKNADTGELFVADDDCEDLPRPAFQELWNHLNDHPSFRDETLIGRWEEAEIVVGITKYCERIGLGEARRLHLIDAFGTARQRASARQVEDPHVIFCREYRFLLRKAAAEAGGLSASQA